MPQFRDSPAIGMTDAKRIGPVAWFGTMRRTPEETPIHGG